MTLAELISALETDRKIHICVHDVSGILTKENMQLDFAHKIHSGAFCDAAKKTTAGYLKCLGHKERVNRIAVHRGRPFKGMCPYGLCELAYPVKIENKAVCIIYLGNICEDREESVKKIIAASADTGADSKRLIAELKNCRQGKTEDYINVAKIIEEYIKRSPINSLKETCHWAVKQAKDYVNRFFDKPVYIETVAALCGLNPRYLGRIFKAQAGTEFSNYVNQIRIKRAKELLRETPHKVTDIAILCGYDDIAYFNRVFKRLCGSSPTDYRKRRS